MATSTALARRQKTSPGSVDHTNARQPARARHRSLRQLVRRLIASIREGDEHTIEDAVLQLSKKKKDLRAAGSRRRRVRHALQRASPAGHELAADAGPGPAGDADLGYDDRLEVACVPGQGVSRFSRPIVLVLFAAAALLTTAAFYLNAAFAFAVSQPGSPQLRTGFEEARKHARAVLCLGAGTGLALGVAAILAPQWGAAGSRSCWESSSAS